MKQFIFSALLLLASGTALAQSKAALDYYKKINLAELAICDSNFADANKYYKDAFTINPKKPFSRDLANAFFSAMDTKQYPVAEKYLVKLLSRGLGGKYLKNMLNYYTGEQQQQLQVMLGKYPNDTIRKHAIAKKIDQMVKMDQHVRKDFDTDFSTEVLDSMTIVDDANVLELRRIFLTQGVLNEDIVGNGGYGDFLPATPDYDLIIWHNRGNPDRLFDTMLFKAIFTFDYDARTFSVTVMNAVNSFIYGSTTMENPIALGAYNYYKNKTIYPQYWDDSSEKWMNANRAKIGLEQLDDYRKKIEAKNTGLDKNSVLCKYSLVGGLMVQQGETEEELNAWLTKNGKDSPRKSSIFAIKLSPRGEYKIDIGAIDDDFVIGKSHIEKELKWYSRILKEYNQGQVPYQNWKDRKAPLPWNYHAELIRNKNENIATDTGRYNQARFVPGYRTLIQYAMDTRLGGVYNIELLYDNDTLISLIADVSPGVYKAMTRHCGTPVIREKKDTISCTIPTIGHPKDYPVTVTQYTWKKGNNKTEIIVSEYVDNKCIKRKKTVYQMTDMPKYAAYLKKVEEEQKRLEKKYTAQK